MGHRPPPPPGGTEKDLLRLHHELLVHQVELEMQNEELRQTMDRLETALEQYTDLYDFAPVGYFTLDRNGTISKVNLTGTSFVGVERSRLIGRRFGVYVAVEARTHLLRFPRKGLYQLGQSDVRGGSPNRGSFPTLRSDRGTGCRIRARMPHCIN